MDSVESELKKFGFDSMIEGVKYEGYNRKLWISNRLYK
jgi:hypothetical protein